MTTSGSIDFSMTRDQIITIALQSLGVMSPTDTTASTSFTNHSTMMSLFLNMAVKQWGTSDFAPGIKMWSRKRGYLFLQTGEAIYTLGPTTTATGATNKWASSYVRTTLNAAHVAGNTALTVSSITGIANMDRLGIELDSGAIQWTTVNGTPTGTTVTAAVGLTGDAASGKALFAYTPANQGRRPLDIVAAYRRDPSVPTDVQMGSLLWEQYESVPNKETTGTPNYYYYEATLTDGTIYLDRETEDVDRLIRISYRSPIEDFDAASDTPDMDQVWYLPLAFQTAYLGAIPFGMAARLQMIKAQRDESLAIARNAFPETSRAFYQPDAPL